MKKILTVMVSVAAILTACNKQPQPSSTAAPGGLQLTVKSSDELTVKSGSDVNIDSFIITFTCPTNDAFELTGTVGEFNEAQDEIIYLEPGEYTVTVTSPDTEDAAWEQPIYGGSKDFTIKSEVITEVEVLCTIQNMKVLVETTAEFKVEFTDYNIVVTGEYDDGNASLTWTEDEIAEAKAGYFKVSTLTITIEAIRAASGIPVTLTSTITDCAAADYHIITIGATNSGSGAISISIDDTVNDKESDVIVPGFENPELGDEDGTETNPDDGTTTDPEDGTETDPDNPEDGTTNPDDPDTDTTPTITWASNPTFEPEYLAATMDVDLYITAPEGIETFLVGIDSDDLESLMTHTLGVTLPMDLINDPDAIELLGSLDVELEGLYGATETDFNISGLAPLIYTILSPEAGSEHSFIITVTDSIGQKAEQTITFIMPEK